MVKSKKSTKSLHPNLHQPSPKSPPSPMQTCQSLSRVRPRGAWTLVVWFGVCLIQSGLSSLTQLTFLFQIPELFPYQLVGICTLYSGGHNAKPIVKAFFQY